MNQKCQKPVREFTEKQRQSLRAVLKATFGSTKSKSYLVAAIRSSNAYDRQHDATKTLKMFLKNPDVPLEKEGERVVRTDLGENR